MPRMFLSIRPPADVAAVLAALDRPHVPDVRWSVPVQWLVHARPLGHVGAEVAERLATVLTAELDGAPAPLCVLGPATVRLGGQWLGVPVSGLDDLGAAVFAATEDLVPVTHPQPFRPHLVLARGRVPRDLAGVPLSAQWIARSLHLVADRSAPGRPRYEDLAAFPLGRGE